MDSFMMSSDLRFFSWLVEKLTFPILGSEMLATDTSFGATGYVNVQGVDE